MAGMSRKNTTGRRQVGAHHVYNRGRGRGAIFLDDRDRVEFIALVGRFALQFDRSIEIHAFCMMTTHFHMVVNQRSQAELSRFMACLMTAYVKYFNRRHGRSGPLFDGSFRARRLNTRREYRWAVAYVNDNHPSGLDYEYSSHTALVDPDQRPGWLKADSVLSEFGGTDRYLAYLGDRDLRKRLQTSFFDLG